MSNTSSARRSQRVVGRTAVASGPETTSPVARTGERTALPELPVQRLGMVAVRARQWSCEPDDAGEKEERREQMDPAALGGWIWFNLVWGRAVGSDMAGTPRRSHIRPIFGLDMRGADQPGRLRAV